MEIRKPIETLQRIIGRGGDTELLERLRAGDEEAFAALVDGVGPSMLRLAKLYVRTPQVAEEVVQETWLLMLRSLDGFEGRSTLRTWIFAILTNCALRRAEREGRYLSVESVDDEGPAVSEECFFPSSHPRWAGMWTTRVDDWESVPEDRLLASEGRRRLREALAKLPIVQALVFALRDVEGWPGPDVCEVLQITAANERVLLHRARARIRAQMEEYLEETAS